MAEARIIINFRVPEPVYKWLCKKAENDETSRNGWLLAHLERLMEAERTKA